MPLKKRLVVLSISLIFLTLSLSGCILENIFGPSFSLDSWSVVDAEGFPAISYDYTCSGYVVVKMYDSDSNLVDSDYFFKDNEFKKIFIGSYKETIKLGDYNLKAYTDEGDEIFTKSFSFDGPELSISSCNQKWWTNDAATLLIGLGLNVYNSGDAPVYPYSIDVNSGNNTFSGLVLPDFIGPGESKDIYCVVYKAGEPDSDEFDITIRDINDNFLSSNTFSYDMTNTVATKTLENGDGEKFTVPYPEFLFDYYSDVERLPEEDYSHYVFDYYDEYYLEALIDRLITSIKPGKQDFYEKDDDEKINFIANFVQKIEYKEDVPQENSSEYANYPIESLFNGEIGCDCEDKSILAANLLDKIGYEVALLRLPTHMAVGVKLSEDAVDSRYSHFVEDYYYLETTTETAPIGFVPDQFEPEASNTDIYDISDRPYLLHQWIDNVLTIYTKTEFGDFIKVDIILENRGRSLAKNILVEGVFSTTYDSELFTENVIISSLKPGMKKKTTLTLDIPSGITSKFQSRVIYKGEIVEFKDSSSTFPT